MGVWVCGIGILPIGNAGTKCSALQVRLQRPVVYLCQQDRSVCVAVSVLRPLLFEKCDVLVAGSFSGLTAAQVAVAAAARRSRVLVCAGDHTPVQLRQMAELFPRVGVQSESALAKTCTPGFTVYRQPNCAKLDVKILAEPFCGLHEGSHAAHRLKVIMVLPRCSCSALNDPVAILHGEHGGK